MKKIILFICFVLSFNLQLNAQLELKIDSIKINKNDTLIYNIEINGYDTVKNYIIDEYSNDGPYFKLFCYFLNSTDSIIILNPNNSKMYISFQYDTIFRYFEVFSSQFNGRNKLVLFDKDTFRFEINFWALSFDLRDYYYHSKDFDFNKLFLTFKLNYLDSFYNLEADKTKIIIFENY